jgi:hypothetical protein
MSDLKPLGSEKLQGDEKLKRILELTYYNTPKKNNSTNNKAEFIKESTNGDVYGIVKEKDGYYVKRGLNESSIDYIGGLFMKNKNRFNSYAEALKRLELLIGQQNINEATKYVLKQKDNKQEAPAPEPSLDAPPSDASPSLPSSDSSPIPNEPTDSATASTPDSGASDDATPPSPDMSSPSSDEDKSEEGKRSDYMAEIQKYAGKLGQEIRDQEQKMESDDIKYVLNMIISAVDLDKLSDEDIEEIGKKFNRDEKGGEEEKPEEEKPEEEKPEEEKPEAELGEIDMSDLDEFLKTPAPHEDFDPSKYADLDEEDTKELDLDEIKNEINKSIGETLSKYFK